MTSMASDRSWLMNPELLKLFHECRRQIQSEFGVRLHLTEENLEQNLADYVSRTRSAHLIRTWEALWPRIPDLELRDERTPPAPPRRKYRGQEVVDDTPSDDRDRPETESEAEAARKKKVVYRGQVIG